MRLRICRQPVGSVAGIPLDQFRAGLVYDIRTELAAVFSLKGGEAPRRTPVSHYGLLLTCAENAGDHAVTLKTVGLLQKPFDPVDLLAAVERALTR